MLYSDLHVQTAYRPLIDINHDAGRVVAVWYVASCRIQVWYGWNTRALDVTQIHDNIADRYGLLDVNMDMMIRPR